MLTGLLKKALIFSAFFYVLIFTNAFAFNCPPQRIDESVRISYVYDGDTLRLDDGRKIRLIGIDTAEIFSKKNHIPNDLKASGESAREALREYLKQANNRLGLTYGQQRFDHYGRTLAHAFLANGENLQARLLAEGHAVAFTTPPNDRMSDCYQQQEAIARQAKRGIWLLPQYQLKYSADLNNKNLGNKNLGNNIHGFTRLQGRVSQVSVTAKRARLVLDERVLINIYRKDMANFSVHMLNQLKGKTIRIRGWLKPAKKQDQIKYIMTLSHPSSLAEPIDTK